MRFSRHGRMPPAASARSVLRKCRTIPFFGRFWDRATSHTPVLVRKCRKTQFGGMKCVKKPHFGRKNVARFEICPENRNRATKLVISFRSSLFLAGFRGMVSVMGLVFGRWGKRLSGARNSRMISPAAVKNLVGRPSTHALRASATARCVLPVPGGPNSTTSSMPATEVQRFQRLAPVVDGETDRRPVVAVEFLGGRQSGLFEQTRAFRPLPRRQLLVHPREHELHLGRGRGLQTVREHLPGQGQAPGEFHDLVHPPARGRASASGVGHGPRRFRHDSIPFPSGLLNAS